ncbi:hypothetical protein CDD82_469 [Ophiocordyceps australis]|uniref:Uncharacterized protein n=1 Tax=Ophiocordyceps australis TaxID=1399860 RepID=A0A2C5YGC6_9HYPO|nr:hypothetical protein CDD82_469 [Ophiocordyceps australis]
MHFSACLIVALGSLASAAVRPDYLPYEIMDLNKRQADPAYQCHADCGGSIRLAREQSQDNQFCTNPNWQSRFQACLKCALKYDNIWRSGYGVKVEEAAQKCGLEAVPEPVEEEAESEESPFGSDEEQAAPRPGHGASRSESHVEVSASKPVDENAASGPGERPMAQHPSHGGPRPEAEEEQMNHHHHGHGGPRPELEEEQMNHHHGHEGPRPEPEEEQMNHHHHGHGGPRVEAEDEAEYETEDEPMAARPVGDMSASQTTVLVAPVGAPTPTTTSAVLPPSRQVSQPSRPQAAQESGSKEQRFPPTSMSTTARPAASTSGANRPTETKANTTTAVTSLSSQASQTFVSGVAVAVLAVLATWSLV